MRNILVGLVILFLSSIFTGCLEYDLPELKDTDQAEMTGFDFEYRWISTEDIIRGGVVVETRTISNVAKLINNKEIIENANGAEIHCTLSLPAGIPESERQNVSSKRLWGYAAISDAAKVEPIGDAPVLGTPGDFTNEVSYLVTAANGSTKTYVIKVDPLLVNN